MNEKFKAKLSEMAWWAVSWVIVAAILVAAIQVYERLNRHNLLVDAILNDYRQVQFDREMKRKALQELPEPDDPVPTEDRKR